MVNHPIVFFDSGIGGLPYLQLAQQRLPEESFIFLADKENFPYGEKSTSEIKQAVFKAIDKALTRFAPKLFVIACNTASVVALSGLRERHHGYPFIGVVPAIKPAALISKSKKVGLIATLKTTEDDYLKNLIAQFAKDCKVIHIPAGHIVRFVENDIFSVAEEKKLEIVYQTIKPLLEEQVDTAILACTHFLHLEKEFKQLFGPAVTVVDSREGVVNQLIRVLDNSGLRIAHAKQPEEPNPSASVPADHTTRQQDHFFITGNHLPDERYIKFARQFNLCFSGTI